MCGETLAELEKPRWIPVTEELPNYDVPVLVTYIGYNDGVPHCDCTAYIQEPLLESMDGEWHWCESYRKVNIPITHWQALPEPATEDTLWATPSADVVEVRHGRWLESDNGPMQKCSVCGATGWDEFYYCPNCGARMDGDGE